jgi:hypothetical protein
MVKNKTEIDPHDINKVYSFLKHSQHHQRVHNKVHIVHFMFVAFINIPNITKSS